ncbi:hypothetical protein H4582DRAFT_2110858 [Lactarius indigo]|nr:hypothetical protein H4582DRAFT_2110858 [Lactarius indigo]
MANTLGTFHGDLLTKECLNTMWDSECIEDIPRNQFEFVVFVLGLFHYKMASKEGCSSTHQHETGLMTSKPRFHHMHNVVHHKLHAVILKCWCEESSVLMSAEPESVSLKTFAETKPDWELIVKISEDIVCKYVAMTGGLWQSWEKPESERDQQFENQVLQNHNYLLYINLCNAINVSFLHWIYIFHATGKHKYASQLARYLKNLHEVHPPELSQWLIEVFRKCHIIVKSAFQLTHWTLKHTPPDMTTTIERLHVHLQAMGCCEFQRGGLWNGK